LRLGAFEVGDEIGRGGMGQVRAAVHVASGTPVALKVLPAAKARHERYFESFRREVRHAAALDHASIARVLDYGEIPADVDAASGGELPEGSPWFVMERVDGGTLAPLRGNTTWARAQTVLADVLAGLAHAHARRVLHRDIKPTNVLLTTDGRARLVDFGIAVGLDAGVAEGESNLGTPSYMAPEQFLGDWRDFGPWTDLYALGCLAWALLCGDPPHGVQKQWVPAARAHLNGTIGPFQPASPVPRRAEEWLRWLCARQPGDRPQLAADAAAALREIGDGSEEGLARARALPPTWREAVAPRPLLLEGAGRGVVGLREPPLVGRVEERDALWQALVRASEGRRCEVVVLRGPSGVGKSRLARWLTERAHEVGGAVGFAARCGRQRESGDGLPGLLGRALVAGDLDREQTVARAAAALGSAGADAVAAAELVHPSGSELFQNPADRFALVARLLRARAGDRAAIVVLDEAHRDPDALGFARWLRTARMGPFLVVLTISDDEPHDGDADAVGAVLHVPPLTPQEHGELIRSFLPLAPPLAAALATRTAGNPLFAVHLVVDWADRQVLRAGPAGFELAPGEEAALPRALADVWKARAERLFEGRPPAWTGALGVAAALGQVVDPSEWRAACDRAGIQADLAALTDSLLQARLFVAWDERGTVAFVHGMLREGVLAAAARTGEAPRLHGAVADVLAAAGASPERVAAHFVAADRLADALPWLRSAAKQALVDRRVAAHLDRHDALLDRLGLPDDDPARIESKLLRALDVGQRGRMTEAIALAKEAEKAAARAGQGRLLVDALATRGNFLRKEGRPDEAHLALSSALGMARAMGLADLLGRIALYIGSLHLAKGDTVRAERWLVEAADAGIPDRPTLELSAIIRVAEIRIDRRDFEGAREALARALKRADETGFRLGAAFAAHVEAGIEDGLGNLDRAAELRERCVQHYVELGLPPDPAAQNELGHARLRQGRLDAARVAFTEVVQGPFQARRIVDLAIVGLAACAAGESRWTDADAELARLSPDVAVFAHPDLVPILEGIAARCAAGGHAPGASSWQDVARRVREVVANRR
jgi:tetratricopeptide (TPR) repeat protein